MVAVRPGFNGGSGGSNVRGNGGGSSGQLVGRAPAATRHLLSLRGTQLLVALPILLAAFALGLQWSAYGRAPNPITLPGLDGSSAGRERAHFTQHRIPREKGTAQQVALKGGEFPQASKIAADWKVGADWVPGTPKKGGLKLAIMTTTTDSVSTIRLWTQYHRAIGVQIFYLFVNGQAALPDAMAALALLPGVVVVPATADLRYRQEHSRIWNETWLSAFFHKPCNHELFVHQSLNMEEGIRLAEIDDVAWVFHVDTDELMYPAGAGEFSLQAVMEAIPRSVDTVIFPNYESMPERDDVEDSFIEVTLFKRNYHHVVSEHYFSDYKTVSRGNPNYFITYGNGKSAARVQRGLRPNGAHRWFNYFKNPKEITSESAAVLHYSFTRFSDLKARRDRCDCAPTEADAARCFILPFDRMAFLAASLKSDAELKEWFRERLIWDDPAVVLGLLRNGLFSRIYTPQIMIRGFMALNAAEEERRIEQLNLSSKSAPLPSTLAIAQDTVLPVANAVSNSSGVRALPHA